MKSSKAMNLVVMDAILAFANRSLKNSGLQRDLNRDLAIWVRRSNQVTFVASNFPVRNESMNSSVFDSFHYHFVH